MDPARRRLRVLSVDLVAACYRAMGEACVVAAILSNAAIAYLAKVRDRSRQRDGAFSSLQADWALSP